MVYLQFFLSTAVIVAGGVRLTRYADILSDRLKLGKVWIGMILLGLVTSLPEAVASLTAVISLSANDLAVGNMFGSNNMNILLIVIMDILYRRGSVTDDVHDSPSRTLPIVFAAGMTMVFILEIVFAGGRRIPEIFYLSPGSLAVFFGYLAGMKYLAGIARSDYASFVAPVEPTARELSLKTIYLNLFLSAALVVGATVLLTEASDQIALTTGLGRTFIGTMLLALVTSLPEMVVTISALRLASLDLAVGNIFGSNMINLFIISLSDFCYRPGALLASVRPIHLLTCFIGLSLTLTVLAGIRMKNKPTWFNLGWDSWLSGIIFVLGSTALFVLR